MRLTIKFFYRYNYALFIFKALAIGWEITVLYDLRQDFNIVTMDILTGSQRNFAKLCSDNAEVFFQYDWSFICIPFFNWRKIMEVIYSYEQDKKNDADNVFRFKNNC